MTDQMLAEIGARLAEAASYAEWHDVRELSVVEEIVLEDAPALLAEVLRLREREEGATMINISETLDQIEAHVNRAAETSSSDEGMGYLCAAIADLLEVAREQQRQIDGHFRVTVAPETPARALATNETMSSERLAELAEFIDRVKTMIEEEWNVTGTFGDDGIGQACKDAEDIAALLAEVDRLRRVPDAAGNLWLGNRDIWREREAALLALIHKRDDEIRKRGARIVALMPFAHQIAGTSDDILTWRDNMEVEHCFWCDWSDDASERMQHDPSCLVTQARAALAEFFGAEGAEDDD